MIKEKRGFTLGETLIALGIIGVLAAILLPFALKAKPDTNKVMYLKAYDTITQQVQKLASNTSLFAFSSNWEDDASKDNGAQIDCERLPFLNDSKPIKSGDYTTDTNGKYSGETKFCNLFAEAMGINNPSCKADVYSFNSADFNSKFNSNKTFTTKNGMQWYVTQPTARTVDADNKKATYQKDIYVDINGNKGPNCIYNSTSCKKPDRFKFELFADGELIPADPMGKLYIEGRRSFLKKDTIAEGTVNAGVNRKAVKSLKYYKEPKAEEDDYIWIDLYMTLYNSSYANKKYGKLDIQVYNCKDGQECTNKEQIVDSTSILNAVLPQNSIFLNNTIAFTNNNKTNDIDKSTDITSLKLKFLGTDRYYILNRQYDINEAWEKLDNSYYSYSVTIKDNSTPNNQNYQYWRVSRPLKCQNHHSTEGYVTTSLPDDGNIRNPNEAVQKAKSRLDDFCNGKVSMPVTIGVFSCHPDYSRDHAEKITSDRLPSFYGSVFAQCYSYH